MLYKPHGDYEITLTGEIFIMRFFRDWNLECIDEFFAEYKDSVGKSGLERFGVLSDLTQFGGGSPEGIAMFREISDWAQENGQIARALIMNSSMAAYIVGKIDDGTDRFPVKVFSNDQEALAWFESLGLAVSNE